MAAERGPERQFMQLFNWAPEHSDALRGFLSRGMSYLQAAKALNARFGIGFSRSAVVGRARRLGLKPAPGHKVTSRPPRHNRQIDPVPKAMQKAPRPDAASPAPVPEPVKSVKLRCVGVKPRLLAFADLEPGDCRYPYGGEKEGEAYAFCGHPRLAGSSYCRPHHDLTHDPGSAAERMPGPVVLRLVRAA
jgi:GcrA cell cycle regulator